MLQEHERGTHGLALERLTLTPMLQSAAGALRHARTLADGMVVRQHRMADNLVRTRGTLLAEMATLRLARHLGRDAAAARVRSASERVRESGEHLVDVLERTETAEVEWSALRDEAAYLGSAGLYVDRVLEEAAARGIETITQYE
jgi:3-carboxy-cis,cis-muconate cycloisomerase